MAYRAVLFDFFGTLTTAVTASTPTAAEARAMGCDPFRFAHLMTSTYPARARGELGEGPAALTVLATMLGPTPQPAQVAVAVRLRQQAVARIVQLRCDAAMTLRRLRAAGLRLGLVSDCTDEVPPIVAQLPIAPLLQATAYSCEVGAGKPDPRLYLTAAHRLGVHPYECLYVGDGGASELRGACRVGMSAVRLAADDLVHHRVHAPAPFWPGPTVRSLAEVPGLLTQALLRRVEQSMACDHWSGRR